MTLQDDGVVFHAGLPNAGEDNLSSISLDKLVFKHPASTYLWRLGEAIPELAWPAETLVVVDRSLQAKNDDLAVIVVEEQFIVERYRNGKLYHLSGQLEQAEEQVLWGVITNVLINYR